LAEINPATDLAVERTRLAHDRTLMAWVRTSASLISFGFTIYKFFQYLRDKGELQAERRFGPREFAVILITIGLAALLVGAIENRLAMQSLRKHYAQIPYSMATLVAGLLAVLGIVALVSVLLRL
jgi:putative membrane protein